jgi:2-methylfumaryl-CoA hydratase
MIPPDGPYFEDFEVGQSLVPAPAITIGPGDLAVYQAITGDPLAVALSEPLARRLTGAEGRVVNPAYVMHVSIGQSTVATRRVVANLFYRGVALRRTVRVGDTLATTVTIRGLRENQPRPDRPPRGMALLGIRTVDQEGRLVVEYERCAMVNARGGAPTGHADDLGPAESPLDLAAFAPLAPADWDLGVLPATDPWPVGEARSDPLRDTVSSAVELARLTQNLAPVHRDATLGRDGRRLVYGGHTIGLAQASLARLLPSLATVIAWHSCDHLQPVYEGDLLEFRATLLDELVTAGGRLRAYSVRVGTERDGEAVDVLDWKPVVLCP